MLNDGDDQGRRYEGEQKAAKRLVVVDPFLILCVLPVVDLG